MRVSRTDLPTILEVPGATARQLGGFGTLPQLGEVAGEWFSLAEGVDIAPLLEGYGRNACNAEHWGYVISGALEVTYLDHAPDHVIGGDLFYWPADHSVRVISDAEVILFSPLAAHRHVVDHMANKLGVRA